MARMLTACLNYDKISAVRFYWRGAENFWLANVKITKALTVTSSQSMKSCVNPEIVLFPNPARHLLNIVFPIAGELMISDVSGQVMYRNRIEEGRWCINIGNWPSGIYFVRAGENLQHTWFVKY